MSWWQRHFEGSTRGRVVAALRRGPRSVEELAAELGLTDNAVRAQLSRLERDGVVASAGVRREGMVGKPATLYAVAPQTSALFSSAYAPVLAALVGELGEHVPARELTTLLRRAGRRIAPRSGPAGSFDKRVRAGASLLASLGADAELVAIDDGYEIRGHSCLLADAVTACSATCRAVEGLLAEVTDARVVERCDRTGAPQCRFFITDPHR